MPTRRWRDVGRKPNRRSSIYLGSDGWWHGWVTVGIKDDGSPDRRHGKARTEAAVTRKVRELERTRDSGHMLGTGRPITVAQWMETWLTTIAPRRIRRSTLETTYAPKDHNRIIPWPWQASSGPACSRTHRALLYPAGS